MVCAFLSMLYGRDTRHAQVINVVVSALWVVAFWLHTHSYLAIKIPTPLATHSTTVLCLLIATLLFGSVGLYTKGRPHQVFKAFGLVLGALSQAVLANGYVTEYPPLDMQIVVCTVLSIVFLLAVFYIFKCEGIDE